MFMLYILEASSMLTLDSLNLTYISGKILRIRNTAKMGNVEDYCMQERVCVEPNLFLLDYTANFILHA
jgi:hypothetical protein